MYAIINSLFFSNNSNLVNACRFRTDTFAYMQKPSRLYFIFDVNRGDSNTAIHNITKTMAAWRATEAAAAPSSSIIKTINSIEMKLGAKNIEIALV